MIYFRIIPILLLSFSGYTQNSDSSLNFIEVFDRAKCISDSIVRVNRENTAIKKLFFKDFDYSSFTLIKGEIDSADFYCGYFDENNKLVKIRHYEEVRRIRNFEIVLFEFRNSVIFGINHFGDTIISEEDKGYGFLPGFFVLNRLNNQIYFVNTAKHENFFMNPIFPVFTLNDIKTISLINSEFYLTNVFHFEKSELLFYTEVIFETDGVTIKKERLYYYNSKLPVPMTLDKNLRFEDLNKFMMENNSQYTDALPCINPANRHIPLWVHFGNHKFCW